MKKGIIVSLKRFKLLDYVTQNKIFIIICTLFIIGVTIGVTVLSSTTCLTQYIESLFNKTINIHTQNTFFQKFISCFLHYLIVLILYFISGASMLGIVVTPFITIWQGIFIGCITSFLYSSYGLTGIAFNAIVFIPPLSIFIICCFFAAKYAIDFSLNIAKLVLPKCRAANLYFVFKNYCSKYLIVLGVIIICSFIEIILNVLFLKYFNF